MGEGRSCKGRAGKNLGETPLGAGRGVFDFHAPGLELRADAIGFLEVLELASLVARREPGLDPALERGVERLPGGEHVEHPYGPVERPPGSPGATGSLPPVQLPVPRPDELEQRRAGPWRVQVVVERDPKV